MKTIILAAGQGSRMKSDKPKVLHEILNKPMINYVIDAARSIKTTTNEIIIVIGHKSDEVVKVVDNEIKCVIQEEQLGTGHAVKIAQDYIVGNEPILVLYGDTPLIKSETLTEFYNTHIKNNNDVTIITSLIDDSSGYGRVIIEGNSIRIVEDKDATIEEKNIKLVNVGIYMFKPSALNLALNMLKPNNAQNEYYLTDALEILSTLNHKVGSMLSDDYTEFLGINTRIQLANASNIIRKKINDYHMENGVTLIDTDRTYISPEVNIGYDTVIHPNCILTGKMEIGNKCVIGANCNLHNCIISNNVDISNSVASDCKIGQYTSVGPFAYIRPNSTIGENCKVGDFVEIKNSTLGNNTKASHLTYIGDTNAGSNINFGCGTITVNYDGSNKHKTTIEDNVFIGCNSNLIAPVTIEENSFVAAGTTVTKTVKQGTLAISRAKQTNIEGWVRPAKN
jgi:bifunctional UDP-N-acetylglucosamine pyrophosphorylase / glucosamine-1-phosphate N-acetyltransferase